MDNIPKKKPKYKKWPEKFSPEVQKYRENERKKLEDAGSPRRLTKFITEEERAERIKKRKEYLKAYHKTYKRKRLLPPKNRVFLSYEEAKKRIQDENVSSAFEYTKWHRLEHPANMPVSPQIYYRDSGWVNWQTFLGTNNTYPRISTKWYRSYDDARAYALSKKFKHKREWIEYGKIKGNLPPDIPTRPDLYYFSKGTWFSWNHFLGSKNEIERIKEIEETTRKILYILNVPDGFNNHLYKVGVTIGGIPAIRDACIKYNMKYIDAYHLHDSTFDWKGILLTFGKEYYEGNGVYDIDNVSSFTYELSNKLDKVIVST